MKLANRTIALTLVSALAAALGGCLGEFESVSSPGRAPYSVSGTVTKAGTPLAGVTVVFEGPGAPPPAVTNAAGVYSRSGFSAGTYVIRPEDGEHDFFHLGGLEAPALALTDDASGVDFDAVPTGSRIDLLSPNGGGNPFLVGSTVIITYRARGMPGASATIECLEDDEVVWSTTVSLDPQPQGIAWQEYTCSEWVPDAPMTAASVRVTSDAYGVLTDASDGVFRVMESGSIAGTVTDGEEPMEGVLVQFFLGSRLEHTVPTEADGSYLMTPLAPGIYSVLPAQAGYAFLPVAGDGVVDLASGENRTGVDFEAVFAAASLTVTSPVEGQRFYPGEAFSATFAATGLADSDVTVRYLRGETVLLEADHYVAADGPQEFAHASLAAPAEEGVSDLRMEIRSVKYPTVAGGHATGFGTWSLTTVSGAIEHPPLGGLEGAALSIVGPNAPAPILSGPDGSFAFAGIRPGSFTLTPALAGYAFSPPSSVVAVEEGVPAEDVVFTATPVGATVRMIHPNGGEVLFAGRPAELTAATSALEGYPVFFEADVHGMGDYSAVHAEPVIVTGGAASVQWQVPDLAIPPELTSARVRVSQADLGLTDASDSPFVISKAFTLSGRVTTDGLTPVENALVSFSGANAPAPALSEAADGSWSATGFRYGTKYTVSVSAPAAGIARTGDAETVALEEFRLLVKDLNADGDFADAGEADHHARMAGSTAQMPETYTTPALTADVEGIAFLAAPAGHAMEITAPGGAAEVWLKGYDSKTIAWTATGADKGAEVEIGFSPDAGLTWQPSPVMTAPNTGAAAWVVGENAGTSYAARLRAVDAVYRLVRGESPDPFVIAPAGGVRVRSFTAGGEPAPDVMVAAEPAGFVTYRPPQVDAINPFLTYGLDASDEGTFPVGLFRLTPSRLGVEFEPSVASASVAGGIAVEHGFYAKPTSSPWTPTAVSAAEFGLNAGLAGARGHAAFWTGSEMVVWGGTGLSGYSGGVWRPGPNGGSWQAVASANAPSARTLFVAVWTGTQLIVWGGHYDGAARNDGAVWTPGPEGGRWSAMSSAGAPSARYSHTAVWTGSELVVWGGYGGPGLLRGDGGIWTPGPDGGSWRAVSDIAAPEARDVHTAVWTGSEMVVWGGYGQLDMLDDGGVWRPDGDGGIWTPMPAATGTPSARRYHTAVWTGAEMIVWGGEDGSFAIVGDGGVWRPDGGAGTWTAMSGATSPSPRKQHTAVWTGSEMVVWGGFGVGFLDDGGAFTPDGAGGSWRAIEPAGDARRGHSAVWTGLEMIVWGGEDALQPLASGLVWRPLPGGEEWRETVFDEAPDSRAGHTAIWTGSEMVVWGGESASALDTGGVFRPGPGGGAWMATSAPPIAARKNHTAIWSGTEMIVWGGLALGVPLGTGGVWTPGAGGGSWREVSSAGAPSAREDHTAVWTGAEMVVWGGALGGGAFASDGAAFTPDAGEGSWAPLAASPLAARSRHTSVWTGSEMVVWGGYNSTDLSLGDGAAWSSGGGWTALDSTSAPQPRHLHTAVWTGSEMIVWGGISQHGAGSDILGDGAIWTPGPGGGSWSAMPSDGAPEARYRHKAVWTGSEMVVWGGMREDRLRSGGVFTPDGAGGGQWSPLPEDGAPEARIQHSMVSTGAGAIVWGGLAGSGTSRTGGMLRLIEGRPQRIRSAGAALDPVAAIGMSGARTLTLGREAPRTRVYCAPNAAVQVHNNPVPLETEESHLHPDHWLHPDTAAANAPGSLVGFAAAYIGGGGGPTGVCVWGGLDARGAPLSDGRFFDENELVWKTMNPDDAPSARAEHAGASLGNMLFVWGGRGTQGLLDDGGIYNPATDGWTPVGVLGAPPSARARHGAAGGPGGIAYVFGGRTGSGPTSTGCAYDSSSGAWSELPAAGAPSPRTSPFVAWSSAGGGALVVWGGFSADGEPLADGAVLDLSEWRPIEPYDPATNPNAPPPAIGRKAVVSPVDGHLIVYGGMAGSDYDCNLYRFDPSETGGWSEPVTTGLPWDPQEGFTLIHTGLGERNNLLMMGGRSGGEPVSGSVR